MVARIKIKDALKANFFYNENKVAEGLATCLAAVNFHKDASRLSPPERLRTLEKIAALNPAIKVNSVHISLNFDPSENHSPERLKEIAGDYMEGIGFGGQPYLVYEHFDAGHPHIHILATKVGLDGKGIDTHNIAFKKSEPVRKQLEEKYNLVRAEDMSKQPFKLKSAYAQKIVYGRSESRRAIASVLEHVLMPYKYASLAELNAVLKLYNVYADRCREGSNTYQNNGLLYRILDDNGKPVGVPIKASSFYNKPTLAFLAQRFIEGEKERTPFKKRVANAIDLFFVRSKQATLDELIKKLEKEGISVVLRKSDGGSIYGITYIDHKGKAVFNGSDLGKNYSAKAILERCLPEVPALRQSAAGEQQKPSASTAPGNASSNRPTDFSEAPPSKDLLDILMQPEQLYEPLPYQLKRTRKKKRKRPSNDI